jgi:amino acid transporter
VGGEPKRNADEDSRLESLGYRPQLNRVLGPFATFAVAFTCVSPMVGVYSLFTVGVVTGGPAYVWLTWIPVVGMLFVVFVLGELASRYPVAGALYQYSKFSMGPTYGWFVGWIYGFALLITVAAVDAGVVTYLAALTHSWFGWNLDPSDHRTIVAVVLFLLAIQTTLNIAGARVLGRVAVFGVLVQIVGTLGIALVLLIHGFNHGLGFLFSTAGVTNAATNPLGLDVGRNWLTGAALIAVLAPVSALYGFEAAGDVAEEARAPRRDVPRAMRHALAWAGLSSFILIAALLLAMPSNDPVTATVQGGGVPFILSSLSGRLQDFFMLIVVFAFVTFGMSIQGAGSRLVFTYARDRALPRSAWISRVNVRLRTPVNALLAGALVAVLFALLVFFAPSEDKHFGFIIYPANVNGLVALASFGVSGIYLSYLLTVLAAIVARARGRISEESVRPGRWGWAVYIAAALYLGLMLVDLLVPTGLDSPRSSFNLGWITVVVMVGIVVAGAAYFVKARPDKRLGDLVGENE